MCTNKRLYKKALNNNLLYPDCLSTAEDQIKYYIYPVNRFNPNILQRNRPDVGAQRQQQQHYTQPNF